MGPELFYRMTDGEPWTSCRGSLRKWRLAWKPNYAKTRLVVVEKPTTRKRAGRGSTERVLVRSNDSHFLASLVRSHFLIPVLSSFDVCLFLQILLVVLIANGRDFFELVRFKTQGSFFSLCDFYLRLFLFADFSLQLVCLKDWTVGSRNRTFLCIWYYCCGWLNCLILNHIAIYLVQGCFICILDIFLRCPLLWD